MIACTLLVSTGPTALGQAATADLNEDWQIGSPAAAGLNDDEIALLEQRLTSETPLLSALLIVRNGELAYERYAEGFDPRTPLHAWSVSKSITSMAIGFALQEGLLTSLDQTVGELLPDRIPDGADPRVASITLEQLLTMTAGWAWDSRINFARTAETDDLDVMLLRPLQCEPGSCFEYDSGCSNLLAAIIEQVTAQHMVEYLRPRLFEPLGIDSPEWIVTVDGVNRGGGGAFLTPRQMARIGQFALQGGVWQGERLLSLRWFARSTSPQSSGESYLSGANIGTGDYGYHWWTATPGEFTGFAAIGYGGQMIYVVPELELVVVTAFADADPERPDLQQRVTPIIEDLIVPAVAAG
ncbi:MAG: serine hydrolase domain-containing protein [Thermomicrobiales bacterium]